MTVYNRSSGSEYYLYLEKNTDERVIGMEIDTVEAGITPPEGWFGGQAYNLKRKGDQVGILIAKPEQSEGYWIALPVRNEGVPIRGNSLYAFVRITEDEAKWLIEKA